MIKVLYSNHTINDSVSKTHPYITDGMFQAVIQEQWILLNPTTLIFPFLIYRVEKSARILQWIIIASLN